MPILFAEHRRRRVRPKTRRRHRKRQRIERTGEDEQRQGQDSVRALFEKRRRLDRKEHGDQPMAGVGQGEVRGEERGDMAEIDGQHAHRGSHDGQIQLVEQDDDENENEDEIGDGETSEKEGGAKGTEASLREDDDGGDVADQTSASDEQIVDELYFGW